MNNKTSEQVSAENKQELEAEHVHGPNCNHHHAPVTSVIRLTPKVGRNDECPCGSQKKFKKCCGK